MLRLGLSEDRGFTLVLPDQTAIVYTENRDRHDKPLDYGVITQKKNGTQNKFISATCGCMTLLDGTRR